LQLLSTFQCTSSSNIFWKDAGAECNSTSFTIQQAVSALLAFCLFVLAALFAAIFYESNSLSRYPDARAHGRADIIMLIAQAALVLVGQTFYDVISTWVIILTAAAAGILWLGAYFVFMPYYQHYMNSGNIAGAAAFLWAVLCLTFNNYYPSTDAAITLYCGAPIAAMAGLAISNYRATHILKTPASRLVNAFEVELKARYMLHEALWGHPLEKAGESAAILGAPRSPSTHKPGEKAEQSEETIGEADLSDDVEDRAVQLRKLIPAEVLVEVQQLYRLGASRFRASSFLHVFCARFYSTYLGNRHMQFSHLLQAEKRSPPTDVLYLVFQARKLAEDTLGGGAGMSAMNRVTFEKYAADARRYVMMAAQKQMAFWAELLESLPDLSRLHTLSTETNDAVVAAEKCFSELYAINPQSLAVIRLYAAFNTHVTCNLDKSMALTAEADRLEDLKSKDHSMEGATRLQFMAESSLDIMAENTAIITIGASTRNLGLISAANSSACKLFGYARVQLERRSALTMLPPPLDRYHEKSLKKYISTGEGTIVDYNRIIFGLHKSGAIVPLLSSIRDAPSDGGPPAFIWLLRELRTPSQYIILDDTNTVLAVTAGGSAILGVEHSAIASREIRIQDYLAEWKIPSVQEDLLSSQGAIIKFEARVAVAVAKTSDEEDGASISSDKPAEEDDEEPAEVQREQGSNDSEVPVATRTVLQETWVRAHLQHVQLEDLEFWVLHCQRLASMDSVTMQRIEQRRAEMITHEEPMGKREAVVVRSPEVTTSARKMSAPSESIAHAFSEPAVAPHRLLEVADASRQSGSMLSISRPHSDTQRMAIHTESLPVVQLPRMAAQTSAPSDTTEGVVPDKRRFGRQKSTRMVISQQVDEPPREHEEKDLLAMLKLPGAVNNPDSATKQSSLISSSVTQPVVPLTRPLGASSRRISFSQPNPQTGLAPIKLPNEQEGTIGATPNFDSPKALGTPVTSRSILKPTSSAASNVVKGRSKSAADLGESRSSGGSSRGTATSKSMVRLRRLLSDGTRGLLPGLWWLRVVGIAITILAIVLAVAVAVIARQSFLQYLDYLGYVNLGAQRKKYKADVFFTLQVSCHKTCAQCIVKRIYFTRACRTS
jgi:PAS domain S-box-containing protein